MANTAKIDATKLKLTLQLAVPGRGIPPRRKFHAWLTKAVEVARVSPGISLCLRIVDTEEMRELNARFRGMDKPTNVLSFPLGDERFAPTGYLGDVLICAPVVATEATEQKKPPEAHWAHMTVHGLLHLLSYDHNDDTEAEKMESMEARILADLGFANPYTNQPSL